MKGKIDDRKIGIIIIRDLLEDQVLPRISYRTNFVCYYFFVQFFLL